MTAHPWQGRHLQVCVEGRWEWAQRVRASGVVAIVALTGDAIVLVEQHRIPVGAQVIELPAGLAGDLDDAADEAMVDAARRELLEETGFVADTWRHVHHGPTSAGMSDETVHLFVAQGLTRVDAGGGDATEDIVVHVVPLADVRRFLAACAARGALVDHKVLTGLWLAGVAPD